MTATVAQALAAAGLDRVDAQVLLLHALGRPGHDRAWLRAHDTDPLPDTARATFEALCARRRNGEPVAYLTGHKAFYGLDLVVDARVLDPRPDTETLVDWVLECVRPLTHPVLVDLGTGSGAIALALAAQRADAQVHAVDASADALAVAQANAHRLGLAVALHRGNWLAAVPTGQRFDAIVSNPPYIREGDPHLVALGHEPMQALVSGADGLDDIRAIVVQARSHLLPGGWLLLEHGHDQADAVCALLRQAGYTAVDSRTDLAGIRRCSGGRLATLG